MKLKTSNLSNQCFQNVNPITCDDESLVVQIMRYLVQLALLRSASLRTFENETKLGREGQETVSVVGSDLGPFGFCPHVVFALNPIGPSRNVIPARCHLFNEFDRFPFALVVALFSECVCKSFTSTPTPWVRETVSSWSTQTRFRFLKHFNPQSVHDALGGGLIMLFSMPTSV